MPKEILIIGEFSTGKTAFANMLLGSHILPKKENELLQIPIIKVHGCGDAGIFLNKDNKKKRINNFSEVPQNWEVYDFLEICLPDHELLKSGLVIWDTEGINSTLDHHRIHLERFLENRPTVYLESVLYFTHGVLTNIAIDFLHKWKERFENLEVVVNIIDEMTEEEARNTEAYIYKTVKAEVGALPVILMSMTSVFQKFEEIISANETEGISDFERLLRWKYNFVNIEELFNKVAQRPVGVHVFNMLRDATKQSDHSVNLIKKLSNTELEVLAKEGDVLSAYELGKRFKTALQYDLAEKYFCISGSQGYVDAISEFIDLYYNCTQKLSDFSMALQLSKKAVELGMLGADDLYSRVYDESIGIEKNENIKLKEIKRSVAKGNLIALRELNIFYNNQIRKVIEAYTNYKKIAETELKKYRDKVEDLEKKLAESNSHPANHQIYINDKRIAQDNLLNFTEVNKKEMIFVQGGEFRMGSFVANNEKPIHLVSISSFFMSKLLVTFDDYDTYCVENGMELSDDHNFGRGNRPVINVSWEEATLYCEWLSKKSGRAYRLPTEAEWEFAAKGGIYSCDYKFSGSNVLNDVAWHSVNSEGIIHEVGLKKPNELGLYDMSGNVSEWCYDWYEEAYYAKMEKYNPKGPETGWTKVYRGGSWSNNGDFCRVSVRSSFMANGRFNDVGFRIVTNAK